MEDCGKRKFKGVWIPAAIWESKELSLQKKCLLMHISSFEQCWSSNQYISNFLNVSVARARQLVGEMVKEKIISSSIERNPATGQVIKRILKVLPPWSVLTGNTSPLGNYQTLCEKVSSPSAKNLAGPPLGNYQTLREKVSNREIYREKNNNENNSGEKYSADAPSAETPMTVNDYFSQFSGGNKEMESVLHQFVDFRKKMRKPLTPYAAKLLLHKLRELSGGDHEKAAAIINQSIMNGWQGLFPIKEETSGQESRMQHFYKVMKEDEERNGRQAAQSNCGHGFPF